MAHLHFAGLSPTKIELLSGWLPTQPWYVGSAEPELEQLGSYRFDDPDGEVGIETLILRDAGGPTLQVPLTYRAAPLDGAEAFLIGTTEHTVLGTRWVYDAIGDPVYQAVLARTILTGGVQAELERERDGHTETVEPTARVTGSGSPDADWRPVDLYVLRVREDDAAVAGDHTLTGIWADLSEPVLLAVARPI